MSKKIAHVTFVGESAEYFRDSCLFSRLKGVCPSLVKDPTSATTAAFTVGEQDLLSLVHSMAVGVRGRGTAQSGLTYTLLPLTHCFLLLYAFHLPRQRTEQHGVH